MQKIVFLNGSPRFKNSTSAYLMSIIKDHLVGEFQLEQYHIASLRTEDQLSQALSTLAQADTILLAFPLYVDSLPSHLISFLQKWEHYNKNHSTLPTQKLFVLANNGFIEGEQNRVALNIIQHFSTRAGIEWGAGVGIGGGEFMKSSQSMPLECKVKRPSYEALCLLATELLHPTLSNAPHILRSPHMSKVSFKLMADIFWLPQAKKVGGKISRLKARPYALKS